VKPLDDAAVYALDMYASGYENGLADGYWRGVDESWRAAAEAWSQRNPAGFCDFTTPYIQGRRPSAPERVYKTRAKTAAQIKAEARYSWEQVERRIAGQRGRRTA
jgi:hypothetical protein